MNRKFSALLMGAFLWSAFSVLAQSQDPAAAQLPDGTGRELVITKCSVCHGLDQVIERRATPEEWRRTVGMMVNAFDAPLTPQEAATVSDYLARSFPGEAPPPLQPDNVTVDIREWEVPWKRTQPRDPSVSPDGTVWFVGQGGHYVANLNPATGEFKRYDLEPGAGPHTQVLDEEGNVWFTGNLKGYIGKLDPKTGDIQKFPMPDPDAGDPHTLAFDEDGTLWFTVQRGSFVGKLEPDTGEVRLAKVSGTNARPYGILVDPEGYPWFAQRGVSRIGRIEPTSMEIQNFPLAHPDTRDRRITRTPDGYIWYGDYGRGYLGRLDPNTGEVKEWQSPAQERSQPYAMAADDKGRIWYVESGITPSRLVGFDPQREKFFSVTEIPSMGRVRNMVFDPKTRSFWFGTDTNTIGRARVP